MRKKLASVLITGFIILIGIISSCGCKQQEQINIIMSAELDNTNPAVGDTVHYDLKVSLESSKPADTNVNVYIDGQLYKSYNTSLVPGENIMTDAWGPVLESQVGEHTILFIAEAESSFLEINKDDNRAERRLSIKMPQTAPVVTETKKDDIKPAVPTEYPSTPVNVILKSFLAKEKTPEGDEVTATALVKIETDKVESFNLTVNIYVNGVKNSQCSKKFTSKKLSTGEYYAAGPIPCPLKQTPFTEPGDYTLRYILDEKNTIKENKETDNTYIKIVMVVPKISE